MSSVTTGCTDRGDLQGVLLGCAFSLCNWKKCSTCPQLGEGTMQWHQRRGRDRRDEKQQGRHGGEKCSGSLPKEAISLVRSCWLKLRIAKVSSDKAS